MGGPVSVFVKLSYWDSYRSSVLLTVGLFRKVLYIWSAVAALFLALFIFAWIRPRPQADWYQMLQTSKANLWAFALPFIFVFGLPLLSARRVLTDERVKAGFSYVFSDAGIHTESSVGKADLQWAAIRRAVETRSSFLLFPTANVAHTLPKSCFATAQDVAELRELLRERVPAAKLRK